MAKPVLLRLLAVALCAPLVGLVATAAAVDDTKPVPCEGQMKTPDPADDQTPVIGFPGSATDSTDMLMFFAKHEPAKGAEAATVNFHVKNLALTVPAGFTSLTWQMIYKVDDGSQKWVRAVLDFSGDLAFEYGDLVPVNAEPVTSTNSSVYRGDTAGKAFEGADGVMQIVVPPDVGGAPNTKVTEVIAETRIGRTVPNSAQTPSRGLANTLDEVPDSAPESTITITQTPCADAGGGGTTPPPGGGGTTPPPGGGGTTPPPPTAGPTTLPIKVAGKVKAPKRRTLTVGLRSTETITNLAAQLRKGTKVVGKGKLAKLARKGKLKLRLSKKVKKGKYVLDLAGNRANGERGVSSLSLRVR